MNDHSLDGKLLFAQNAIANALNNDSIKSALAVFGYDDVKLQEGQTLYEKAASLHEKQKKEYGDQYAATDVLNVAKAEVNKIYRLLHLS